MDGIHAADVAVSGTPASGRLTPVPGALARASGLRPACARARHARPRAAPFPLHGAIRHGAPSAWPAAPDGSMRHAAGPRGVQGRHNEQPAAGVGRPRRGGGGRDRSAAALARAPAPAPRASRAGRVSHHAWGAPEARRAAAGATRACKIAQGRWCQFSRSTRSTRPAPSSRLRACAAVVYSLKKP